MALVNLTNVTGETSVVSFLTSSIFSTFVVALIILFCGLILGKLLGKLLQKILNELEINVLIEKLFGIENKADELLATILSWFIYVLAVVLALGQLGVATFVFNAISIFLIMLTLILVFLSIKDFIPNVIAGLRIHHMKLLREGDTIKVDRAEGEIVHISLLDVSVETKKGDIMIVPTSYLLKNKIRVTMQKR